MGIFHSHLLSCASRRRTSDRTSSWLTDAVSICTFDGVTSNFGSATTAGVDVARREGGDCLGNLNRKSHTTAKVTITAAKAKTMRRFMVTVLALKPSVDKMA